MLEYYSVSFNLYGQVQLLCEEKLYDRLWELLKDTDLYTVLGYEDERIVRLK